MSNCKNVCRLCNNFITSTSVTVVTVDGVDNLVIDLPANIPCGYTNCRKVCFAIIQNIPATATILMPVSISIGGDTTTVYPLLDDCCNQITACGIRTRTRYSTCVSTRNGGSFRMLGRVNCYPQNVIASLPIPATAPATPAVQSAVATRSVANATPTSTTTKKTTAKTVDSMTVQANNVTISKGEE